MHDQAAARGADKYSVFEAERGHAVQDILGLDKDGVAGGILVPG